MSDGIDQLIMLKHLYGNTLTVLLLRPVNKESTPSPQSLFPRDCASAAATYTEALPMCDKVSAAEAQSRGNNDWGLGVDSLVTGRKSKTVSVLPYRCFNTIN